MKQREHTDPRRGASKPAVSANPAKHWLVLKTRDKKEVERERREERRKQKALIDEWGVTEEELQKAGEQNELSGREAAYNNVEDEAFCRELISDAIGEVRDRYETIVTELLAARYTGADGKRYSLATVLRNKYKSDSALKEILPNFAKSIREWVLECIRERCRFTPLYRQIVPPHNWNLCGYSVSKDLVAALSAEYVRDRGGLMRFVSAVFKHWRKLFAPYSTWRVRLLAQQITGTSTEVAAKIEEIGATPRNSQSLGDRVRQYRSRDQRSATQKKILMPLRAAGKRGFTAEEISERTHFSTTVVSDALSNLQRSRKAKWKWWQPNKYEKRQKFWFVC